MYHFFIQAKQIEKTQIRLTGADVNHIKNVLRMRPGERAQFTDEDGVGYLCAIRELEKEQIIADILDVQEASHELPAAITLYQGIPKGDKFDLIIQKAVELGVCQIVPVMTARCIVKLDDKKKEHKKKRWNEIAKSAAKQSKRSRIPTVCDVLSFEQAISEAKEYDLVCIPYEQEEGMHKTKQFIEQVRAGMKIAVYIGPEGGYEESEIKRAIENQICPISLGKRVLRTETAGIALLSMMMLCLECQTDGKMDQEK